MSLQNSLTLLLWTFPVSCPDTTEWSNDTAFVFLLNQCFLWFRRKTWCGLRASSLRIARWYGSRHRDDSWLTCWFVLGVCCLMYRFAFSNSFNESFAVTQSDNEESCCCFLFGNNSDEAAGLIKEWYYSIDSSDSIDSFSFVVSQK